MTTNNIEKQAVPRPFTEIGVTGLKHFSGQLYEEFLRDLQGDQGRRIYIQMSLNDPIIAGLLFAVEMPMREVSWFFEPATNSPEDIRAAEFLESARTDMSHSWADFISQVLSMLVFGWSYFEIVYKRRRGMDSDPPSIHSDGLIGWRKFAFRAQDTLQRWEIDDNGGIRGLWQQTMYPSYSLTFIPISKSILFRTRTDKNSPEGRSILRAAYRSYYFRSNLETLEGIALERMGAGFPVVYLPQSYTNNDLTAARDAVRKIRVDEQMGLTFPGPKATAEKDGWLFELVSPPSSRGVATGFAEAIVRHRSEMLISVLASFIALGTQNVGSFALSRDQRDFFQVALEGWGNMIGDTFDRFASLPLLRLNRIPFTSVPKLKHTDIGQADLKTLSLYIQSLGNAGFIQPDPELEDWLRRAAGFPERKEAGV